MEGEFHTLPWMLSVFFHFMRREPDWRDQPIQHVQLKSNVVYASYLDLQLSILCCKHGMLKGFSLLWARQVFKEGKTFHNN